MCEATEPTEVWRTLIARHPANCDACGRRIAPGARILWDAVTKRVRHADCDAPVPQTAPPRESPARTAARRRALNISHRLPGRPECVYGTLDAQGHEHYVTHACYAGRPADELDGESGIHWHLVEVVCCGYVTDRTGRPLLKGPIAEAPPEAACQFCGRKLPVQSPDYGLRPFGPGARPIGEGEIIPAPRRYVRTLEGAL